MNGLALCAGVGMLDIGVLIANPGYRPVVYVERQAEEAATLVARMEPQGPLPQAPVWDDLTTFDARAWRGRVDIVTAGFPCQPFSVAGQRKGVEDERWIWGDIIRIIRDVGCEWVFLENVPGLLTTGLGHVLGDLAEAGFDAEWRCVSAASVGASHRRQRVFILAHARDYRRDPKRRAPQTDDAGRPRPGRRVEGGEPEPPRPPLLADASGARRPEVARGAHGDEAPHEGWPAQHGDQPERDGEAMADAAQQREREPDDEATAKHQGRAARQAPGGGSSGVADATGIGGEPRRAERPRQFGSGTSILDGLPLFAPGPQDADAWAYVLAVDPTLGPAIRDMGNTKGGRPQHGEQEGPQPGIRAGVAATGGEQPTIDQGNPAPQPAIRGVANGVAPRVDRLRMCGNGVVPLAAALAYRTLKDRLVPPHPGLVDP